MKKLLLLLLILAFQTVTGDEPTGQKKKEPIDWFKEASYCIAYELKDTHDKISEAPAQKDFEDLQRSRILQTRTHLNVAALTTRISRQKLLTKEQIAELTKATFKSKVHYPTYDCYFPHHIFIFYDDFGDPRACIEVCFECVAIKYARNLKDPTFPKEIYTTEEESDPFGGGVPQYEDWSPFQATGDFLAIAKICIDSGMGLGTFKTIEEFQEKHQPAK